MGRAADSESLRQRAPASPNRSSSRWIRGVREGLLLSLRKLIFSIRNTFRLPERLSVFHGKSTSSAADGAATIPPGTRITSAVTGDQGSAAKQANFCRHRWTSRLGCDYVGDISPTLQLKHPISHLASYGKEMEGAKTAASWGIDGRMERGSLPHSCLVFVFLDRVTACGHRRSEEKALS